jgi:hypothetical protein
VETLALVLFVGVPCPRIEFELQRDCALVQLEQHSEDNMVKPGVDLDDTQWVLPSVGTVRGSVKCSTSPMVA